MDITVAREFNTLYIYLDVAWLVFFAALLIWRKRYTALIVGLIGGIIYFAVDYGYFYRILDTRVITGADPFQLLLWLSLSYGFTNMAWIWLLLEKKGKLVEWSLIPILGWIVVAQLSQNFGGEFPMVSIYRGTGDYHGIMSVILVAGYLFLIIRNFRADAADKVNLLRLMAIGIGVQLSWEFILLISGIRPTGILPLIVDSLIETNLGMPYLYLIHKAVSSRRAPKAKR